MPMEKRTAQFPLTGGQDNRVAPQLLQAPQVTSALNLYRARTAEWAKRFGFHYLPAKYLIRGGTTASSSPDKIRALGGRANSLVVLAKDRWWERTETMAGLLDISRSGSESSETRMATHKIIDSAAHESAVGGSAGSQDIRAVDVAYGNGFAMTVWQTGSGSVNGSIVDLSTGQVQTEWTFGTGARPKVIHSENAFMVFIVTENGGGTPSVLNVHKFSSNGTNGPTFVSGPTAVVSNMMSTSVGTPWYDVQVRSSGNILIGYRTSIPDVRALEWDPTTNAISIGAAVVVAGDQAANAIGWVYNAADVGTAPRLLTAANTATGVVERLLNTSTLAQTATVTILATPGDVASITGVRNTTLSDTFALWELRPADTTLTSVVEGHTNPVSTKAFMGIGCLASKPFQVDGGTWYVAVTKPWELQPGYSIVPVKGYEFVASDLTVYGVAARVLPGAGMSLPPVRNALSHVGQVTTTRHLLPCMRIYDFTSTAAALTRARRAALADLEFDGVLPRPVSYSRSMIAPGSVCRGWSGDTINECGFLYAPERPTGSAVAGAGMSVGNYQYKVCWAVEDGEGRVLRSAPSPSVTIATSGGNLQTSVTFKQMFVCGYAGDTRVKQAKVEVYRTKANGTSFFRLPQSVTYRLNGTNQTVTFGDATPDTDLETNAPLYTDGGELFNEAPGPCVAMAQVGLRLVGIPAEDRTSVFASKEIQPGFGVGFHPDLRVPIVGDGDNYAVAAMENRTVVFKRQAIYVLTGDWPNANGQGSLPIAQRVAVGFGTIEAESVRESQDGVWFKDPSKGMCLLTRGLDVVQLGKPQQDNDSGDLVGVEAAEDDEQVRALLSNKKLLIYDTLEKQWSTWEIASSFGTPTCSAVVNGTYYWGTSSGRVAYYNTAAHGDNDDSVNNAIPVALTLRMDMGGKEGVHRLYRATVLGTRSGGPTLVATFVTDYGVTSEAKAGLVPADQGDGSWAASFRPQYQRAATHLLTLAFSSGSNQGFRFAVIAIEYGLRAGLRKLGAASIQ